MSTPRVVIVGAGFGGLSAAKALAREPVSVTLIDRRNHHLFQPLLYQVATAGLSPADIAWPVRSILGRQRNVQVLLGTVSGVDLAARTVAFDGQRLGYDYLVIATGARHHYFGHPAWEGYAPGLKSVEDAIAIRRRILMAFETAEMTEDAAERARLLTFVVVGAGPTGVELAGAIAELAKKALAADFRTIDPRAARVVLVEAGPRMLSAFPAGLAEFAHRALERLGVEVALDAPVTACDASGVELGNARIEARTILWAAGVQASPAAEWLGAEHDAAGRIAVAPDLTVPGCAGVYAIGDLASVASGGGGTLPGVAAVARQQGIYVARHIAERVRDKASGAPFRYLDVGNLATIGRKAAVADFGWVRLRGWLAWWIWAVAHIYFLIDTRNRLIVAINWMWSYVTFERGARLITGEE